MTTRFKGLFNRIIVKLLLLLFGVLLPTSVVLSSWVPLPSSITYPHDLSKIKGKPRFFAAYAYGIVKDTLGLSKEVLLSKSYASFHSKGNTVVTEIYGDHIFKEYVCLYDTKGNVIEKKRKEYENGVMSLSEKYIYKYDGQGRIINSLIYAFGDTLPALEESFGYYPKVNQVIHIALRRDTKPYKISTDTLYYDPLDKVPTANQFSYKQNGEYLERTDFGKGIRWIDLSNKIRERVESNSYDSLHHFHDRKLYTYDDNGNEKTVVYYRNDSLKYSENHKYIYDKMGNWTIDTVYRNTSVLQIIRREFVYF